MKRICGILLFVFTNLFGMAQEPSLMTPGELLMMIKDDELNIEMAKWDVKYEDTLIKRPLSRENVFLAKVNDSLTLREASYNAYITKYQHLADQNLAWRNYKKAGRYYREAYKQDTSNFNFITLIGLCLDLEGQVDDALDLYKRVIKLNPIDYRAFWRIGMIYYAQDNFDKALGPILRAHLLNRNNISIEHFLDRVLAMKKLRYKIWDFVPRSRILSYDKRNLQVATDSCWYAYAQTKSYLYHSQFNEQSPISKMTWQVQEEMALKVLFGYLDLDQNACDESLQALMTAVQKGFLSEYVYYEIILPSNPELAFFLSSERLNRLAEYVTEVRVVSRK